MLGKRRGDHGAAGESEAPGEEEETLEAHGLPEFLVEGEVAMEIVAEDGRAVLGEVEAYLVGSSGAELELEPGEAGRGRGRR